jgi:hypothetical protein
MVNADSVDCVTLNGDHKLIAEAPDQTELPFMCLKYGQEEAAKHPVPEGKFVKVQCVHKSVPRFIE